MPNSSTMARDTKFVSVTDFVSFADNNRSPSLKQRFSVIIGGLHHEDGKPLTNKEIALVADCGEVTVKAWKAERQLPQLEHAMRLASTFETVAGWLNNEIDALRGSTNRPDRMLTAAIFALQQSAGQPTEEGAMARALLKEITKGRIS